MDFFTSAVLGGLLYDALKTGMLSLDLIKSKLTPYSVDESDCKIIEEELQNFPRFSNFTEEDFVAFLHNNSRISPIVESKANVHITTHQTNHITTLKGAVIDTNTAPMIFNFGKE